MRNKFKSIISIFILLSTFSLFSQESSGDKKRDFADEMMEIGETGIALEIYKTLLGRDKSSGELNYRVGLCTTEEFDEIQALKYFQNALKLGFTESINKEVRYDKYNKRFYSYDLDFNLARGFHKQTRFAKAIKHYKLFLLKELDFSDRVDIEKMLQEAKNGWYLKKNKTFKGSISNMEDPLNSEYNEYGSHVLENGKSIIFTRQQPNNSSRSIKSDGTYKEDIYVIEMRRDSTWFEPHRIDPLINKDSKNDEAIALSDNDSRLIIKYKNGALYESVRENVGWSIPVKLPKLINSIDDETGLTFGKDVMIVASNRAGSYGGQDLFVSFKDEEGGWTYLEPLDSSVNSAYDEATPYLDPETNTLYFSSKGHNTMGGFDVFKSEYNPVTKTWSKTKNIGYPINSPEDEIYFSHKNSTDYAYYSSSRVNGYGGYDIYRIDYNEAVSSSSVILSGVVHSNDDSKTPLEATITIKDAKNKRKKGFETKNNSFGKFKKKLFKGEYFISIHNEGYYHIDTLITVNDDFLLDVELDPILEGEIIPLSTVNFERNKADIQESSYAELDRFSEVLKANPKLGLEIAGHTEIGGISSQNKELSQKRADAVRDYLVVKGIDEERLLSVGYGSKYPLSKVSGKTGANRRTELIVHKLEGDDWKPFYK